MATAGRGVVAIPPDEPINVVGRPGALRVNLPLVNSGASALVIRDAAIRNVVAREGKRSLAGIGASLTAVLASGQASQGQLRLQMDPHTPPGDYVGEIEIAGTTHPLALTIVEQVRLSIDPDPIFLEGAAGSAVRKTVLFRNLGNVPLHIRHAGAVPLGEELPFAPTATAEIAVGGRGENAITNSSALSSRGATRGCSRRAARWPCGSLTVISRSLRVRARVLSSNVHCRTICSRTAAIALTRRSTTPILLSSLSRWKPNASCRSQGPTERNRGDHDDVR